MTELVVNRYRTLTSQLITEKGKKIESMFAARTRNANFQRNVLRCRSCYETSYTVNMAINYGNGPLKCLNESSRTLRPFASDQPSGHRPPGWIASSWTSEKQRM